MGEQRTGVADESIEASGHEAFLAAESPNELEQRIRFALSTLGQRNAHHEFEQLCLGVARRRITSNLMPATGPVSAGGDQGRDAESFWTNLPVELPDSSLFVAMASTERVVMACTIQAADVRQKVASDLAKLAEQDVHRVLYFHTGPLPVGHRHDLQQLASETHGISLEFWDVNAIAIELVEHDLFYLAVRYLDLPSSLAPPVPSSDDRPSWYTDDLARWRQRDRAASTMGDLIDLRQPLRHATFHAEATADLPEWLDYLRPLLEDPSKSVRARARYEYLVATLRGLGTLKGHEDMLRAYFTDLSPNDADIGIVDDATILVEYAIGAWGHGVADVTETEIESWRDAIRDAIRHRLDDAPYPNLEVILLTLSARMGFQPAIPNLGHRTEPAEGLVNAFREVAETVTRGELPLLDPEFVEFLDLDGAMRTCVSLLERARHAPMAPLQDAIDRFDLLAPVLRSHPLYRKVRDGFDDWVARIEGDTARGGRAQRRAIALLEADEPLEALQEVHEAKIRWWHGDTVEGAVTMCLLASRIYGSLGLHLAAKSYALAATGMAGNTGRPELTVQMPRGLLLGAEAEFYTGAWVTSTRTALVGILAQHAYCDDPMSTDRYGYLTGALLSMAHTMRNVGVMEPGCSELLESWYAEVPGTREIVEQLLGSVESVPTPTIEELEDMTDREGLGRPFSDVGARRRYTWAALGLTWDLSCDNERETVLAAERFGAALQITLAELAHRDPLLLSGRVRVDVTTSHPPTDGGNNCTRLPDNSGSRWQINLTPLSALDDDLGHLETTQAVMQVVADRSLLPRDDFTEMLEQAFADGVWHKLLPGRPHDEWAGYIEEERYEAMAALAAAPGADDEPMPVAASSHLLAIASPAPGYDRAANIRLIATRYENMLPMLRYTIASLAGEPDFRATIDTLRSEGWLDWHLLSAMANAAGDERLRRAGKVLTTASTQREHAEALALITREETEDDEPIAASVFTVDSLRSGLDRSLLVTIDVLGMAHHSATPDFDGIREFLGRRFALWTDDAPHDPIFPPLR